MASSPPNSAVSFGGKDSSLTPSAVYAVSSGTSFVTIDSAALEKLSHSKRLSPFNPSKHGQQASTFRKSLRNKTRSPATVQKSLSLTVPVLQEEIVPLSGNSFFTCVISRSQISGYRMVIPHHFCELLPDGNVPATLYYGNRRWEVKYCGSDEPNRFSTGWRSFVNDTKISLGDGCVFELMDKEKLHFRVQILRAQLPVLAAEGGDTSDSPIVID